MQADRDTAAEGILLVGFLALTAALAVAHRSPASGYEASLYTATPTPFWACLIVALASSLVAAFFATTTFARRLAVALGLASGISVASLPIVRGYYFYGYGDALTHLGWARDVAAGQLSGLDLFYPGLHTSTVLTSRLLGISIEMAMMLAVLSMLGIFLVFVPLCVREVTDRPGGLVVGTFAALLVLPVNHVAFHYMNPHPISEAIMLSPLVLYLLLRYLDGSVGPVRAGISAVGVVLGLSLVATVLYHSMQAANLLAVFVLLVAGQFVVRRLGAQGVLGSRRLLGHTVFLAAIFVGWNLQFSVVLSTVETTIRSMTQFASGQAEAGAVVSSRSSSLSGVGAGIEEIFLKLFVPSALFALLTAAIVLKSIYDWKDQSLTGVRILGVTLAGVSLFTLPFVAGNVSKLVFRNLGFVMVLGTILGAVCLHRITTGERGLPTVGVGRRAALVGVMAVMLAVSLIVLFPSPYIYQPNGGVSQAEYQGYETAFDLRDESVTFLGVRSGPQRMIQSIYGREGVPSDLATFGYYRQYGSVTGENLTRLPAAVETPRYLLLSEHDRTRELVAYRGFRYSRAQFESVPSQRGVNRVLTNGPFELYLVDPEE